MNTFKIKKGIGDKNITMPLNLYFKNNGYSDLIQRIGEEEKQKNVNLIVDAEKMRFYVGKYGTTARETETKIKFIFKSPTGTTYGNSYIKAGFSQDDIDNSRNRLTKSFFRLDFYDSDNENTQNFLFSEQIYVGLNLTPTFNFNFIYWVKNDINFIENNTYRNLYFSATFFDASNGLTKSFLNTTTASDITLNDYKQNKEKRFVKIRVLNPYTNQQLIGSKNNLFYIEPINGNTDTTITFTELNFA